MTGPTQMIELSFLSSERSDDGLEDRQAEREDLLDPRVRSPRRLESGQPSHNFKPTKRLVFLQSGIDAGCYNFCITR